MQVMLILIFTETNGCVTEEWQAFDGSCYMLVLDGVSWMEAREACHNNNADLVVIETEEEEDFLRGMYVQL